MAKIEYIHFAHCLVRKMLANPICHFISKIRFALNIFGIMTHKVVPDFARLHIIAELRNPREGRTAVEASDGHDWPLQAELILCGVQGAG